ncbi:PREDICTED: serine protease inhibitor 3-like [Wasmannia auropunctata]|uniref:serine protease inhibitor 3-like n=1 Tax=Wasmannia auropunctata TaxID=64793 RepID=UPI0005F0ACF2|nr:PREDICTED: serine protease inhibitor 3-like [Wasmannia auropunctata]
MSCKYIVLTLMIVMITSVALIQGASIAPLPKCTPGFTYYDGCNSCSCDVTILRWICSARWCGGITLKPPPCLCI